MAARRPAVRRYVIYSDDGYLVARPAGTGAPTQRPLESWEIVAHVNLPRDGRPLREGSVKRAIERVI